MNYQSRYFLGRCTAGEAISHGRRVSADGRASAAELLKVETEIDAQGGQCKMAIVDVRGALSIEALKADILVINTCMLPRTPPRDPPPPPRPPPPPPTP